MVKLDNKISCYNCRRFTVCKSKTIETGGSLFGGSGETKSVMLCKKCYKNN